MISAARLPQAMLLRFVLKSTMLAMLIAIGLAGCGDDSLPLSSYETYDVGVWFNPPGNQPQVNLGVVRGAAACGRTAHQYAALKQYSPNSWGYVCCTHRKGSTCYEKIR